MPMTWKIQRRYVEWMRAYTEVTKQFTAIHKQSPRAVCCQPRHPGGKRRMRYQLVSFCGLSPVFFCPLYRCLLPALHAKLSSYRQMVPYRSPTLPSLTFTNHGSQLKVPSSSHPNQMFPLSFRLRRSNHHHYISIIVTLIDLRRRNETRRPIISYHCTIPLVKSSRPST